MRWYDMAMESLEEDFAEGFLSKKEFDQEVRYLKMELLEAQRESVQRSYDNFEV